MVYAPRQVEMNGEIAMKQPRLAALLALLPGLLLIPAATVVQATAGTTIARVTLAGSVGRLPARFGVVLVEAELALGRNTNAQHVATRLEDVVVASERITSGTFQVGVPDSATLRRAEQLGNGNVNFIVLVESGSHSTFQKVPVPLTTAAAAGNVSADVAVTGRYVHLPSFNPFRPITPAVTRAIARAGGPLALANKIHEDGCAYYAFGNPIEDTTRIGEVHSDTSVDLFYTYHIQADTTLTVGFSNSSTSGFSADGSVTASNSMGATGGFPANTGVVRYADGHMYYQRYSNRQPMCALPTYEIQVDHAVGDAFYGSQVPPVNPYGGCAGFDPNGYAQMQAHGGTFDSDRATARGYSGSATLFGFSFGGHTGFTNDILQSYKNVSGGPQFVCGTTTMPDTPVIYSGDF
jgi:hypothetical protein